MIDLDNQGTLKVNLEALEKIAQTLSDKEVELIITNDKTIQKLNKEYRGKDNATDVLSFPLEELFTDESIFRMPLGSIVIAESFVKKKAEIFGHSLQDELSLLFIHGMLHLLGFDHEGDDGEMRAREKELIIQFNLPESLIVRTEDQ
ncbi:rRNA maturation RNase YbeY [Sulfurovum sp.]|uniref:rRNA maturation RNase YbeY n=1 Tax=Sulfurovum sp. TaxID=1969726 RepID=UPI0028683281|nr:rRNA maturation RNase YbeY [Sulfurovum sp.]